MKLLDKLKIDDVVGAIPAHLIVEFVESIVHSLIQTHHMEYNLLDLAFGVFTVVCSSIVWTILKVSVGIRASDEDEEYGLDLIKQSVIQNTSQK